LPRAASLAEKLLNKYKNRLAQVALIPSSGGAFEITANGETVYSKLETGRFPDERVLLAEMDTRF